MFVAKVTFAEVFVPRALPAASWTRLNTLPAKGVTSATSQSFLTAMLKLVKAALIAVVATGAALTAITLLTSPGSDKEGGKGKE